MEPPAGKDVARARGRVRISGKTSITRLSIAQTVGALGIAVDALRRRIWSGQAVRPRDEHGQVYVLVGAYSNAPIADHSRQRKPGDEAEIKHLEAQAEYLRATPWTPEEPEATPGASEAPSASLKERTPES